MYLIKGIKKQLAADLTEVAKITKIPYTQLYWRKRTQKIIKKNGYEILSEDAMMEDSSIDAFFKKEIIKNWKCKKLKK